MKVNIPFKRPDRPLERARKSPQVFPEHCQYLGIALMEIAGGI